MACRRLPPEVSGEGNVQTLNNASTAMVFEETIIVNSKILIAHQRTIDCRVLRKLLRVAWTPSSAMAEIGFLFNSFCGFMWTFNNTRV